MTRILIVDDDEFFAYMMAERLRQEFGEEVEIDQAVSGEDALQLVEAASIPFDVLLIDHRLGPGMDGLAAMQAIQQRSPGVDSILFTGFEDQETGLRAYEAGAFRYVAKPFEPIELVWIVRLLLQRRSANYERNWLRTLSDVADATQKGTSLREVAQALVAGGAKLGFRRARIFRIDNANAAGLMLEGIAEIGHDSIPEFAGRRWPLAEAIYAQRAYTEKRAFFFHGDELGPGVLVAPEKEARFPLAVGEWVVAPLLDDEKDRCVGVIVLDYGAQNVAVPHEVRQLLHLFFRQTSSAFGRAVRDEEQQVHNLAASIVARVRTHAASKGESSDLDVLLDALHDELVKEIPFENLIVVLRAVGSEWFQYSYHVERSERLPRHWQNVEQSGLIAHVISLPQSLYLPRDVNKYRDIHKIPQVGVRPAQSFIGVQLRSADNAFGAIIVENDSTPDIFTSSHRELLEFITADLASLIQVTWLSQRAEGLSRPLRLMQQASYDLMLLAKRADDSFQGLWDATCVLATAPYGFGFDRAMLFLAEEGGQKLQGVAGLGCHHQTQAERNASLTDTFGASFEEFVGRYSANELKAIELRRVVQQMSIVLDSDESAFSAVLKSGKPQWVKAKQTRDKLPQVFIDAFGETNYHIVPLKSVSRTIGLLVVNRRQDAGPDVDDLIPHLDALTNQVAVLYENWRNDRAQKLLVDVTHSILLMNKDKHSLKLTLQKVCEAARAVLGADLVAVFPLKDDGDQRQFDLENVAHVGYEDAGHITEEYHAGGLTESVLTEKDPVVIKDISQDQKEFAGKKLTERKFIIEERIKALIAVPIIGHVSHQPRGVLFVDFRSVQNFAEWEIHLAESLAHLAAVAIRNWREARGLIQSAEEREKELESLGKVLQEALRYGDEETKENNLIVAMLRRATELLSPLPVRVGLLLLDWQRKAGKKPIQVRQQFYLRKDGGLAESTVKKDPFRGISGRAMSTGATQHAPDVRAPEWEGVYYNSGIKTRSEVDIPVKLDKRVLGVLNVESTKLDGFHPNHIAMLERFAAAAALALDNVHRQRRLGAILDAAKAVTAPTGLPNTLQAISNAIQKTVPDVSALTIWYKGPESDELELGPYFGVKQEAELKDEKPEQSRTLQNITRRDKPLWAPDVQKEPELGSEFVMREGIFSCAAFPLNTNEGNVGAIFFNYRQPHLFTREEQTLFPALAEIVASAVKDARLFERAEKQRKRVELALDITNTVGAELDLEQMIAKILTRLQSDDLFPKTTPAILLYNKDDNTLEFASSSLQFYKPDNPQYASLTSIPVDESSIAGAVAIESIRGKEKKLRNIADVGSHPDYLSGYLPVRLTTRSQMAVTLYSEEQGLLGVLVLESDQLNAFDHDAEQLALNCAKQIRLAVERARQREELEFNETLAAASAWSREIAHDINQEIFEIRSWADALRYESEDLQKEKAFQKVDAAAQRLAGANLPERQKSEEIALDETLRHQIVRIIQEQDSAILLDLDGLQCGSQIIDSYPFALERIFRHLVRNSRQAMQRAGMHDGRRIRVATRPFNEEQVEIEYSDNGPGFPFHLRSRVFRARLPSEQDPQRGVGLLLVRFIVGQVGGSIHLATATRDEECGARFVIRLPCRQAKKDKEED
jgi:GAF domain-containing protein/DNA-binding response OmpR family regulator